jgi:hypothetical protein
MRRTVIGLDLIKVKGLTALRGFMFRGGDVFRWGGGWQGLGSRTGDGINRIGDGVG